MVVPTFRGPGYGALAGAAIAEGGAGRLKSFIDNRAVDADILGSLMANSEKVAGVAGSGALDTIAGQYAGAQGPIFGTPYASTADAQRQRLVEATISKQNRVGTGGAGGGAGGAGKMKSTEWIVRDSNGNITVMDAGDMGDAQLAMLRSGKDISGNPIEVLQMGKPYEGDTSQWAPSTPPPAATQVPEVPGVPSAPVTAAPLAANAENLAAQVNAQTPGAAQVVGGRLQVKNDAGEWEDVTP